VRNHFWLSDIIDLHNMWMKIREYCRSTRKPTSKRHLSLSKGDCNTMRQAYAP
jgi:hypothetical protein